MKKTKRHFRIPSERAKQKQSAISLPSYLCAKSEAIAASSADSEAERIQTYVTMRKRFRGATPADSCGIFIDNRWCGGLEDNDSSDVFSAEGIQTLNIVAPAVRVNTATLMGTDMKVEVRALDEDNTQATVAASVAQDLFGILNARDWTSSLKQLISQSIQLEGTGFLYSFPSATRYDSRDVHNAASQPSKEKTKDKTGDIEEKTVYEHICKNCGTDEILHKRNPEYTCPVCGSDNIEIVPKKVTADEAEIYTQTREEETDEALLEDIFEIDELDEEKKDSSEEKEYSSLFTGERSPATETIFVPAYEVRLDERNSIGADLQSAQYFQHRFLVSQARLEAMFPDVDWIEEKKRTKNKAEEAGREAQEGDVDVSTENASISENDMLQWQLALNTHKSPIRQYSGFWGEYGRGFTNAEIANKTSENYIELQITWLTLDELFECGALDADIKLPGCDLEFKKGDILTNRLEHGLCYIVAGGKLLWLADEDFRDHWVKLGWELDGSSAWFKGIEDILPIQDRKNELLTIITRQALRNSTSLLVIDNDMLDKTDFDIGVGAIVTTKESIATTGMPLQQHFTYVPPAPLAADVYNLLGLDDRYFADVTGITPALVGQSDPTEDTFAGQQLKKMSSLGLFTGTLAELAEAKRKWFVQQIQLIKNHCDYDALSNIRSNYGSTWKDSDIDAFFECKLNNLDISIMQGSEIPVSILEKKLATFNLIQSGIFSSQLEIPAEIRAEIINYYSGLDLDFNNYQSDMRIARTRIKVLQGYAKLLHKEIPDVSPDVLAAPETLVAIQAIINTEPRLLIVADVENYDVQRDVYGDAIRVELSKDSPDLFVITLVNAFMDKFKAISRDNTIEHGQEAVATEMAIQQPMMEQQQQMAAQQQAAQAEAAAAQAEQVNADRAVSQEEEAARFYMDELGKENQHERNTELERQKLAMARQLQADRLTQQNREKGHAQAASEGTPSNTPSGQTTGEGGRPK